MRYNKVKTIIGGGRVQTFPFGSIENGLEESIARTRAVYAGQAGVQSVDETDDTLVVLFQNGNVNVFNWVKEY